MAQGKEADAVLVMLAKIRDQLDDVMTLVRQHKEQKKGEEEQSDG